MINTKAEFTQGKAGQLFRLTRTPECVQGHLFFLPPLFEQANQTRHMLTRSAINAYQHGIESIVFDYYGTGDSAGELKEASLLLWQQDIIAQLIEVKNRSAEVIILSVSLSAALLLNNEMLSIIDGLILVQAEFNGKRFVQQFKRLALAANLEKPIGLDFKSKADELAIAGYVMRKGLLEQLSQQKIDGLFSTQQPCCWFEWQSANSELSTARAKQYQIFQKSMFREDNTCHFYAIDDVKYWQSTELEVADQYLHDEQQALAVMLSAIVGEKTC